MRIGWLVVVATMMLAGCGSPAAKMQTASSPTWPALDALQEDVVIGVGMEMEMAGPQQAVQALKMPHVAKAIENFANEPIPSQFATSAREAAKKQVVESLGKLTAGGSDEEMKAHWEQVMSGVQTLKAP